MPTPIQMEGGPFGFIMADPAWRFATFSERGRGKSAEQHYATMTMQEIKDLDVASIAAKDCILWLWATTPMFEQQLEVVKDWGFTYKTQGTWVKTTKAGKPHFGTGYLLRNAHEPYIIATRGKPKISSRSVRSVIMAPRREHSRKPDEAYRDAALMAGDVPKADLFSRQSRDGWSSWGFERTMFDPNAESNDNQIAVAA